MWICSPSQFHSDQIIACAKAGKHVFCEKPIATDLQQTILAIDACDAAGVKLMIGLQRRFDKNFGRVKKAMDEKEVGEPFLVRYCMVPVFWKSLVGSSTKIYPLPYIHTYILFLSKKIVRYYFTVCIMHYTLFNTVCSIRYPHRSN